MDAKVQSVCIHYLQAADLVRLYAGSWRFSITFCRTLWLWTPLNHFSPLKPNLRADDEEPPMASKQEILNPLFQSVQVADKLCVVATEHRHHRA